MPLHDTDSSHRQFSAPLSAPPADEGTAPRERAWPDFPYGGSDPDFSVRERPRRLPGHGFSMSRLWRGDRPARD